MLDFDIRDCAIRYDLEAKLCVLERETKNKIRFVKTDITLNVDCAEFEIRGDHGHRTLGPETNCHFGKHSLKTIFKSFSPSQ